MEAVVFMLFLALFLVGLVAFTRLAGLARRIELLEKQMGWMYRERDRLAVELKKATAATPEPVVVAPTPKSPPSAVVPKPAVTASTAPLIAERVAAAPAADVAGAQIDPRATAPRHEEAAAQVASPGTTPPRAAPPAAPFDWESLIGVRAFSWIGGAALFLSAIYLFRYSIQHGWLRPAFRATIGFAAGIAFLALSQTRRARQYAVSANALSATAILILYATAIACRDRWHLLGNGPVFTLMIVCTVTAVTLAIVRDSFPIALMALAGGFSTPYLLRTGVDHPISLFSYLLLLNAGLAWVGHKRRWPALIPISFVLATVYQVGWAWQYLETSKLPIAFVIFLLFPALNAVAAAARRQEDGSDAPLSDLTLFASAFVPLLFGITMAAQPAYSAHTVTLFAYLFCLAAGLLALALSGRAPKALHGIGAVAALGVFLAYFGTRASSLPFPSILIAVVLFPLFYLAAAAVPFVTRRLANYALVPAYVGAGLLYVYTVLFYESDAPVHSAWSWATLFLLVATSAAVALLRKQPYLFFTAWAMAVVAIMTAASIKAPPAFALIITGELALVIGLMLLAARMERHELLLLGAVAAALFLGIPPDRILTTNAKLAHTILLYLPFILYPALLGRRVKRFLAPHVAAVAASAIAFVAVHELRIAHPVALLPLSLAAVLALLFWQLLRLEPAGQREPARLATVAGAILAFLTVAIPMQLHREWITIGWALEAAALVWLYRRIPHRGLLVWSAGIALGAFLRIVCNPGIFSYYPRSFTPLWNWYLYTYLIAAAAFFLATWWLRDQDDLLLDVHLRHLFAAGATVLLFILLNIEIADWFARSGELTFDFFSDNLARGLAYTLGWAAFAIAMLIIGIVLRIRSARIAALILLVATILKCFLYDLIRLGGLYVVASLLGLGICLFAVAILLQRFVIRPAKA